MKKAIQLGIRDQRNDTVVNALAFLFALYIPQLELKKPKSNLYTNVYNIPNGPRLEGSKMTFNGCKKLKCGTSILRNTTQQKKELRIHVITQTNLQRIILSEKSRSQKVTPYSMPFT